MYIDKITLTNVRGFKNLEFDLGRGNGKYAGWTVFTGGNGSGKSTLLKAIAVALTGRDVARLLQPTFHRWIREGDDDAEGRIELMIVPEREIDEFSDKGNTAYKKFPAVVVLKKGDKEGLADLISSASKTTLVQRGPWSASPRVGSHVAMGRLGGYLARRRKLRG